MLLPTVNYDADHIQSVTIFKVGMVNRLKSSPEEDVQRVCDLSTSEAEYMAAAQVSFRSASQAVMLITRLHRLKSSPEEDVQRVRDLSTSVAEYVAAAQVSFRSASQAVMLITRLHRLKSSPEEDVQRVCDLISFHSDHRRILQHVDSAIQGVRTELLSQVGEVYLDLGQEVVCKRLAEGDHPLPQQALALVHS